MAPNSLARLNLTTPIVQAPMAGVSLPCLGRRRERSGWAGSRLFARPRTGRGPSEAAVGQIRALGSQL
ncbi:hypothetical protein [Deinococcus radiophilus]|uniref:hypothetical protein n=1 Tax=Deinococcus radiophilus TaxID=32062 RepID=UPI0014752D25|nr:hypothetical protein [Deinococcus radiophilus]UFA50236.1 hypothetical protein LMT64_10235 [Deinococcus radiophilus]